VRLTIIPTGNAAGQHCGSRGYIACFERLTTCAHHCRASAPTTAQASAITRQSRPRPVGDKTEGPKQRSASPSHLRYSLAPRKWFIAAMSMFRAHNAAQLPPIHIYTFCRHRRALVLTHPAQLPACPKSIEPLPCERRTLHGPGKVSVQSSTHPRSNCTAS